MIYDINHPTCTCPHCLAEVAMKDKPFSGLEKEWIHRLIDANLQVSAMLAQANAAGVDLASDEADAVIEAAFAVPASQLN